MIPVLWWNHERMSYSCCNMLNELFDFYECEHYVQRLPDGAKGCIFLFHGGSASLNGMGGMMSQLFNQGSSGLEWIIFVGVGDEATEFPYQSLSHPNMRLWVQTPLPSTKADRYLIEGYPAHTIRTESKRYTDVFFSGQNTHQRRHAMIRSLEKMRLQNDKVRFMGTDGFGKGLPQAEYLNFMSSAKIVPCPSGPASPDTFRIWEALECGAVPIVDARSLREETNGFWNVVLGDHPLPMIEDWSDLPEMANAILSDYNLISRRCQYWWRGYKIKFRESLAQDLLALGAK